MLYGICCVSHGCCPSHVAPALLQALKSAAEEYGRILDILSRYAVYHPTVGFSCKRQVRGQGSFPHWCEHKRAGLHPT